MATFEVEMVLASETFEFEAGSHAEAIELAEKTIPGAYVIGVRKLDPEGTDGDSPSVP